MVDANKRIQAGQAERKAAAAGLKKTGYKAESMNAVVEKTKALGAKNRINIKNKKK